MSEELNKNVSIEKSTVTKAPNGMTLESKYLKVCGEKLKDVEKTFDKRWKNE